MNTNNIEKLLNNFITFEHQSKANVSKYADVDVDVDVLSYYRGGF